MLARAWIAPAAALLLADVTGSAARLEPATARFGRPIQIPAEDWSNWDLSFDGSTIGATQGDQRVVFYDTLTGREIASIETEGHSIHDTAISGDGRHYALTLDNGTIEVYSAQEKKKVGQFSASAGFCCSLGFSGDGRWLIAENNGSFIVWDVKERRKHDEVSLGLGRSVYTYASPNGRYVVSFSTSPTLVDLKERRVVAKLDGLARSFAQFSQDGRLVMGVDHQGDAVVWDTAAGAFKQRFGPDGSAIMAYAFSPGGAWIAVADAWGRLRIFEGRTGRLARSLQVPDAGEDRPVFHMAFDSRGQRLVLLYGGMQALTLSNGGR